MSVPFLLRKWAVDWLSSHNPSVCEEIFPQDFSLSIGTHSFGSRDAYVDATMGQLQQFPGLMITVHELIVNEGWGAMHLSEHGASLKHGAALASWNVVALFEIVDGRIARVFAEEDYAARRRQLSGGEPDLVGIPAVAPWDVPIGFPVPQAEATVREWVETGMPGAHGIVKDDADRVSEYAEVMRPTRGELDVVMSSGSAVAFHGRLFGTSEAEIPGIMSIAGLVHVSGGAVTKGRVVTDRLGALQSFKNSAAP